MKTSKQLSQEVMQKIAAQEKNRQKMKTKIKTAVATLGIFALLLPTSVYLFTGKERELDPLSQPDHVTQPTPTPPALDSSPETDSEENLEIN